MTQEGVEWYRNSTHLIKGMHERNQFCRQATTCDSFQFDTAIVDDFAPPVWSAKQVASPICNERSGSPAKLASEYTARNMNWVELDKFRTARWLLVCLLDCVIQELYRLMRWRLELGANVNPKGKVRSSDWCKLDSTSSLEYEVLLPRLGFYAL